MIAIAIQNFFFFFFNNSTNTYCTVYPVFHYFDYILEAKNVSAGFFRVALLS